jgi:hypothetical protein
MYENLSTILLTKPSECPNKFELGFYNMDKLCLDHVNNCVIEPLILFSSQLREAKIDLFSIVKNDMIRKARNSLKLFEYNNSNFEHLLINENLYATYRSSLENYDQINKFLYNLNKNELKQKEFFDYCESIIKIHKWTKKYLDVVLKGYKGNMK